MPHRLALAVFFAAACRPATSVPAAGSAAADVDAGALPAPAAPPDTPDAGTTVASDARADSGVPTTDGGSPEAPDSGAGLQPGSWRCDAADASAAACAPTAPPLSAICRPPIEPALPTLPAFDGGIPGPCVETRRGNGTAVITSTWSYDAAGHVLTQTQTDGVAWTARGTNTWDACGRLVYSTSGSMDNGTYTAAEYDYGPEGLLVRRVSFPGPDCEQRSGYAFDDAGQVATVYDPGTCKSVAELKRDAGLLLVTWPSGDTRYDLLPDGGVARWRFASIYGTWGDYQYDELGRPMRASGTAGTYTSIIWGEGWTWEGYHLVEHRRGQQGNGISQDSSSQDSYSYDGGVLVHEEHWASHMSSSGEITDSSFIDYSYPDAGVRLAGTLASDGGMARLERDFFDARGNLLRAEESYPPDFSNWTTLITRSYDCVDAP